MNLHALSIVLYKPFVSKISRAIISIALPILTSNFLEDEKVQVGNDREKAQSERHFYSKDRGGKNYSIRC